MRIRVVVAAVALLAGATTSFFGGRYDPPHDEAATIATRAMHPEVTQLMLRDVKLPVIDAGGTAGFATRDRNFARPLPLRGLDHVDVVVTAASLRVGGRDVATVPIDPLQTSGSTILPLAQAVAFEREVVVAAGGSPAIVHLYVDETTPYETYRAVAASFDVPVRLAARAPEGGNVVFVSWDTYTPARVINEFAIDLRVESGLVVLVNGQWSAECHRIPPIGGHLDLQTLASCVAPHDGSDAIVSVTGNVDYGDFVGLLAILDAAGSGGVPRWNLCVESECKARALAAHPERSIVGTDFLNPP